MLRNVCRSGVLIFCLIDYTPLLAQGIAVSYREKDHWGYADTLGNIILKPIYDDVRKGATLTSALLVAKDKKWGVVSTDGKVLVPMKHSRIMDPQEGYFIAETIEGGNIYKYGLYNEKGRMLLPPGRQEVSFINNRVVVVRPLESASNKLKRAGVALLPNGSGAVKWIIPRNYHGIYFRTGDSVFVAETDVKRTEFSLKGTTVTIIKETAIDPADEMLEEPVRMKENALYGGPIEAFQVSLLVSDTVTNEGNVLNLKKSTQGFRVKVDTLVLSGYESIHIIKYPNNAKESFLKDRKTRLRTNMWAIVRKGGRYGAYFTVPRDAFIPLEYDSIGPDIIPLGCEAIVVKAKKDGKWGLIRIDNTKVTDFLYDDIIFRDEDYYGEYHKSCFRFKRGLIVKTSGRYNVLVDSAAVGHPDGFENAVERSNAAGGGIALYEGRKKGLYIEGDLFMPSYEGDGAFGRVYAGKYPLVDIKAGDKLIGFADRRGVLYFKD